MLNSLKYAKVLENVGFTRPQAEAQMEIITEIMETNLATKQDIKDLAIVYEQEFKGIKQEFQNVRQEIKDRSIATEQEFKSVRQEIKDLAIANEQEFKSIRQEIKEVEYRLTIKLGTIVSIAIGVAVTLTKIIS